MAKKHDENKDLRSFSRIGSISYAYKTLRAAKNAVIGIHMWGKIDFLTHYCGWRFIWDNGAGIGGYMGPVEDTTKSYREAKRDKKAPKLTDKTRKSRH